LLSHKELAPGVLDLDHAVRVQEKPITRMNRHRRQRIGRLGNHAEHDTLAMVGDGLNNAPPFYATEFDLSEFPVDVATRTIALLRPGNERTIGPSHSASDDRC
jgi:hypothetical protein